MEKKFVPGQLIWCIEIPYDYPDEAELTGYLYMAECKDYIICCPDYVRYKGNFDYQLSEMCRESNDDSYTSVSLFKKEYVFEHKDVAKAFLEEFLNSL